MQHDEVTWQIIRHNHCSFMTKIVTGNFCRNLYNVTGICNRSSCPLANSRYVTIRDHEGVFYLYMKAIERAHKPNELWERVKLPRNYEKALELIDKHLEFWPKFLVHKTKQRLTKMTQYRIRMRKLQLKVREKIVTMPRKQTKREARREEKAERAAVLDKSIEQELLERLKKGVYGDIYNYPVQAYDNVLKMEEMQAASADEEEEPEVEYVEGYDELEEEEEDMEDFGGLAIDESLRNDGSDGEDEEIEAFSQKKLKRRQSGSVSDQENLKENSKLKKKGRVIIEVEHDDDTDQRQTAVR